MRTLSPPLPDPLPVPHAPGPLSGIAPVPGSKSITNRALALAALAEGPTVLTNALFADDTARMMDCLRALGFVVDDEPEHERITVHGQGGVIPANRAAALFVGNSGTTARFITPLAALGHGTFLLDGVARMRERPIGDLLHALQALGVHAESVAGNGCPPLRIDADGLHGGACTIRADKSSQFLSGLLLAAPCAKGEQTVVTVDGPLLSAPYITITVEMVRAFGGVIHVSEDGRIFRIPGNQMYRTPGTYAVEPDASSATYFWGAAAITGGTARVPGIGRNALQGDAAFVDVLSAMGCGVRKDDDFIEITGTSKLTGGTFDMNAISDTVMTLAAIAPFADSPTVLENIAHIRHKETDRIAATVTELRRLGVRVDEREDGFTIYPCDKITPTAPVRTYDDHRMAMAFALIGLRVPGVQIADPSCVNKTFPDYFARLERLVRL
ncbi:MAG: 3-phosphoshikimate 1-carboxyvinyltransferase [Akkermansiaceae bacterium]|nr:3-phosphoshikimate 1-carboxyvinyltransferase [Armatimonadota bacterium]